MRIVVCLHAAAAVRGAPPLHPTDRRVLALARALGAEVVALEAAIDSRRPPPAAGEAVAAGADRGVQVIAEALGQADARTGGFVLAAAIDRLQADLVLFGDDADPEGAADVPGAIAHHMGAVYLVGVEALAIADAPATAAAATEAAAGAAPVFDATVRGGGWLRRLRLASGGVLGIAPADAASATAVPATATAPTTTTTTTTTTTAPTTTTTTTAPTTAPTETMTATTTPAPLPLTTWTLADLNLDETLVRRRDDRRGVIEAISRPLVTLDSAAALAAFLGASTSGD